MPYQEQEQEQEQEQKEIHGAAAPAAKADVSASTQKPKRDQKPKATVSEDELVAMGVTKQHAQDWLKTRKDKGLPLTKTALDGVLSEAALAGLALPEAIERAAKEGWAGFKAAWVGQSTQGRTPPQDQDFSKKDYGAKRKL